MRNLPRKFGIEIEGCGISCTQVLAAVNDSGIPAVLKDGFDRSNWCLKADFSIKFSDLTWEIVSPPLQGIDGLNEAVKVANILRQTGGESNFSCGLHVHIDGAGFTVPQAKNIYEFYRHFERAIDQLHHPIRRGDLNFYCQSLAQYDYNINIQRSTVFDWAIFQLRNRKVNLTALAEHGTIEFRQLTGTVDSTLITAWVTFLQRLVEVSKDQLSLPYDNSFQCLLETLEYNGEEKEYLRSLKTRMNNERLTEDMDCYLSSQQKRRG